MSTRIYYAFRVEESMNKILDRLVAIRSDMLSYISSLTVNEINKNLIKDYDEYKTVEGKEKNFYADVFDSEDLNLWVKPCVKKNNISAFFTIFLIPLEGDKCIIKLISSNDEFMVFFNEKTNNWLSEANEYDYYDNTDKPDSLTEEEWDGRSDFYNGIFSKYYNFKSVAFSYDYGYENVEEDLRLVFYNSEKNLITLDMFDDKPRKERIFKRKKILENSLSKDGKVDMNLLYEAIDTYKKEDYEDEISKVVLPNFTYNFLNK